MNVQASTIHGTITEGFYQVNMKARPESGNDVIAYEQEAYTQGFLAVWVSGGPDYLPEAQLKAGLGLQ